MNLFKRKKKIDPRQEVANQFMNLLIDNLNRANHPPMLRNDNDATDITEMCRNGAGGKSAPGPVNPFCTICGHLFDRMTGTSRQVKLIHEKGFDQMTEVFFCSMHIPKWDTAEVHQIEKSARKGDLRNFRKSFSVTENGRLIEKRVRKTTRTRIR